MVSYLALHRELVAHSTADHFHDPRFPPAAAHFLGEDDFRVDLDRDDKGFDASTPEIQFPAHLRFGAGQLLAEAARCAPPQNRIARRRVSICSAQSWLTEYELGGTRHKAVLVGQALSQWTDISPAAAIANNVLSDALTSWRQLRPWEAAGLLASLSESAVRSGELRTLLRHRRSEVCAGLRVLAWVRGRVDKYGWQSTVAGSVVVGAALVMAMVALNRYLQR
ncbi:MAG TPA: hypothetical protein VHV55_19910 [Pirellulales bacterium]|nr:hypothetical protein [Pirellulales bacterium]